MIRVMVVDDEVLAQDELTRLIQEDSDFKVVNRSANGKEALKNLKKESVDVVFLDIEMPGMTGLEVASNLVEWDKPPLVIFQTAHHKYAIQAFEANAIDYVMKPYDPERLKKAFERVKAILKSPEPTKPKLQSLDDYLIQKGVLKKLVGHRRKSKDRIVIDPNQVYYFHSRLSEVIAHVEGDELIVRSTLKDLRANLDPEQFAQTHKAYLSNLDKIAKVSPMFSGNYEITLKDTAQTKIPLSRRYAKNLKKHLGVW